MIGYSASVLILICLSISAVHSRSVAEDGLKLPSDVKVFANRGEADGEDAGGTRWAVLIAGSNGYWNYRHQADVCHAYQILKSGGLKDENIVVFMYDDIAFNEYNPVQGSIINNPHGNDVYRNVPKDYTGDNVTVDNFFAVLLGNKSGLTGGSGKVVDSGPDDHIFVYYTDHGGPGVLGMPSIAPYLYANDLIEMLKKKHASGTYKSLVFYIEACESGSIFEGLLPEGMNIYATTASNAEENSWGTYCPGMIPPPPPGFDTCLGDLYSVAWMEDSDTHNLRTETLKQQYKVVNDSNFCISLPGNVKKRTLNKNRSEGSHVMQYGDIKLDKNHLYMYFGTNPANDNITFVDENSLPQYVEAVNQRDADLLHFWHKYNKAPEGSSEKLKAQKNLHDVMRHRVHVDNSVNLIGELLFGYEEGERILKFVRPAGQPLVNDWACLKNMVSTFETHCGSLAQYGMKHMRAFANLCNAGVSKEQMAVVSAQACVNLPTSSWNSISTA
ncbi:hypothetical protein Sjap_019486 [Stephania japonica]|uniref:Legumain prodomain domain-containing protein n=1 Tax=Stephania japonica TaxID=461633 RepID=A0AAP0F1Q0_9MAGN